jgi:hypothetical protein
MQTELTDAARLVLWGLKLQLEIGARPSRHDLARALMELVEKGRSDFGVAPGSFPIGAYQRTKEVTGIKVDPMERVSWLAALLPYLDERENYRNLYTNIYNRIDRDRSWRDPRNWLVARLQIPAFLDPDYPANLRSVMYPGLAVDAGATHFVGVAGVGLDAPEYREGDPAVEHKMGVFGYNRSTTLKSIPAERRKSLIVVIEVPGDGPAGITPWLAGGGSTVRGIPEDGSIQPFVGNYPRGRGVYVIMADGAVRFLSEKTPPEIFKAMCAIKGQLPEGFNLDKEAPKVDPNAQTPPQSKTPKEQPNIQLPTQGEQPKAPPPAPPAPAQEKSKLEQEKIHGYRQVADGQSSKQWIFGASAPREALYRGIAASGR